MNVFGNLGKVRSSAGSRPEVFLGKGALKICSRFTGEHPCRSAISIKLLCNFIEIALRHGSSPVNLLHIFRVPFPKNTSGRLLLKQPSVVFLKKRCFKKFHKSHRKTPMLETLFNKETSEQVSCCQYNKIFKRTFIYRTPLPSVLQKSISKLKCFYSKNYEINSNQIFTVVKLFHCLHLEVFID